MRGKDKKERRKEKRSVLLSRIKSGYRGELKAPRP
jgi:hypothetical protein